MARKTWTAAELDSMSATEIDAIFEAGIVRSLDDAPAALLARTRERTLRRIDLDFE